MSIIRTVHDREHPYAQINRATLSDARLSWGARGLLIYLLSKPHNWEVRMSNLQQMSPAGRDAVRALIWELQKYRYLTRTKQQDEQGRWEWICEVREIPAPGEPLPDENAKSRKSKAKPSTGFPSMVDPSTAKASIYKEVSSNRESVKSETTTEETTNSLLSNAFSNPASGDSRQGVGKDSEAGDEGKVEPTNPSPTPKKGRPKHPGYPEGSEALNAARWLYAQLKGNDTTPGPHPNLRQPDFQKWAKDYDQMMRLDGRQGQGGKNRFVQLVAFGLKDDYTWPHMQSMGWVKKKWDALDAKTRAELVRQQKMEQRDVDRVMRDRFSERFSDRLAERPPRPRGAWSEDD